MSNTGKGVEEPARVGVLDGNFHSLLVVLRCDAWHGYKEDLKGGKDGLKLLLAV